MKLANTISRKHSVLVQSLFIFIWLSNFIRAERFLPLYLLLGVFGVLCLWSNTSQLPAVTNAGPALWLMSALLSVAVIGLNLAVFDPVASLLSISNMAMSLVGGTFVSYQILFWLLFNRKDKMERNLAVLGQAFLVYLWLVVLIPTDARYSVYVFCALTAILCVCHNGERNYLPRKRIRNVLLIFAGLFSLAVVLSNYPLYTPLLAFRTLAECAVCLLGGGIAGYHVLLAMMIRLPVAGRQDARPRPWLVFGVTFVCVSVICLAYLFFSCYPGILSRDSHSTIEQIIGTQAYNNTMPFWHTITVQPFVRYGMSLFGNLDAGIALFHCVQILFMAMCFSCVLVTLYQIGVPNWLLVMVFFTYACIPYNIVYSVTLWKDVPFAGAAVLFVTGLYRLTNHVGKSWKLNYCVLLLGMVGFSLMRTNGWYAFLATVVVMALVTDRKHRRILIIMATVLILCWTMINPVLDALDVAETNMVEAFAVPMQQVARVVSEGRSLTTEETELLSGIFWLDDMTELYNPLSVDPVKFLTFRNENVHLITENPGVYLKLYFQLGVKYPGDYLKAWIDETKGFWNAGYEYWLYSLTSVKEVDNLIANGFVSLFRFLNETEALKLFSSVGLYVWGMIGCCVVNVLKKREEFLLSIPLLVLVVGLWLGSPVFCEFRYAYPVVLTLPFIACVTMYKKAE